MTERTDCIWFVYIGGQDVECDPPVSSLSLTMNCGWELIKVIYSNYGRTAPYDVVCPYPRGSSEDVARVSSIADQISCDGQRWCQVNIVPPATDPCLNTGKYAEVRFVCQGKRDNFSYPNLLLSMKMRKYVAYVMSSHLLLLSVGEKYNSVSNQLGISVQPTEKTFSFCLLLHL